MSERLPILFLGTGNFNAKWRYWNSSLIDGHVLVEPSPSALANLHQARVDPCDIDVIFLSHFHADHSFGWPFFLLSYVAGLGRTAPLTVVGPPGIDAFLDNMVRAGAIHHLVEARRAAGAGFPLAFIEVNEQEQSAAGVGFRAVRVEHDPALDCFGYLLRIGGRRIGYSGDTRLCAGLEEIAAGCDTLILECNQMHDVPPIHMSVATVRTLRERFPRVPFVLTHMGHDVDASDIQNVTVPGDLARLLV